MTAGYRQYYPVASGTPLDRDFDPRTRRRNSPSLSADSTASMRMASGYGDKDVEFDYPGEEVDDLICSCGLYIEDCDCDTEPLRNYISLQIKEYKAKKETLREFINIPPALKNMSTDDLADMVQAAGDIVGTIPGFEIADLGNALVYFKRGKYLEGVLSLISTIPVVGDAIGKGGKAAGWAAKFSTKFPKTGKAIGKYGPGIVKQIKLAKKGISENKPEIDELFAKLESVPGFKEHVVKAKEALNAFVGDASQIEAEELSTESRKVKINEKEDEDLDEISALGVGAGAPAIRGVVTPLGTDAEHKSQISTKKARRSRRKKQKKNTWASFGGAK
jgi:hypothetical protein